MYYILIRITLGCALICCLRPCHSLVATELSDGSIDHGGGQGSVSEANQEHEAEKGPPQYASIETQLTPPPLKKESVAGGDVDQKDSVMDTPVSDASSNDNSGVNSQQQQKIPVDGSDLVVSNEEENIVEDETAERNEAGGGQETTKVDAVPDVVATPSPHAVPRQQHQSPQDQSHGVGQQHQRDGVSNGVSAETTTVVTSPLDKVNATTKTTEEILSSPPASQTPLSTENDVGAPSQKVGMDEQAASLTGSVSNTEGKAGMGSPQPATPGKQDLSSTDPYLETMVPTTTDLPRGVGGMALETPSGEEGAGTLTHHMKGREDSLKGGSAVGNNNEQMDGKEGGGGIGGVEDGKKGDEDFPTFDKWSVQYLAEQERQKNEKEVEQTPDPAAGQKLKKLRLNFASKICGSKIVASNPEAENTDKLLNNNPDEYMISPCKAKKWFVAELCEPVQIHGVELGTVELFSSPPKSFQVSASQRYPSKEWFQLGKFEMTAKRSVQSFKTTVVDTFVNFIRVELLEHHGEEHYCPITAFRVLGLDMASDDDEEGGDGIYPHDEQGEPGEGEEEEEVSVSLFEKTKVTVVNLVKKVLYTGDDSSQGDKTGNDKAGNDKAGDQQRKNTTAASSESGERKVEEIPSGSVSEEASSDDGTKPSAGFPLPGHVDGTGHSGVGQGGDHVGPAGEGVEKEQEKPKEPEEIPIITKLADTEQLPTEETEKPVVVKLEDHVFETNKKGSTHRRPGHACRSPWQYDDQLKYFGLMVGPAYYCSLDRKKSKSLSNKYVDTKTTVPDVQLAHDKTPPPIEQVDQVPSTLPTQQNDQVKGRAPIGHQNVDPVVQTSMNDQHAHQRGTSSAASSLQTPSSDLKDVPVTVDLKKPVPTTEDSKINNKGGMYLQGDSQDAASSQTTQFMASDVSNPTTQILEPSSLSPDGDLAPKDASAVTPVLDIEQSRVKVNEMGSTDVAETVFLKVSPSPTTSSLEVAENTVAPGASTTSKPVVVDKVAPQEAQEPSPGSPSSSPGGVNNNGNNNQAAKGIGKAVSATDGVVNGTKSVPLTPTSGSGRAGRQIDLVKVPLSSGSKRDASIMKLNNRIVALEQNVSMAKRYLEELSKAFKQQNEDMMTLVNRTVGKLKTHETLTEDRDLLRQTEIDILGQRVSNLSSLVISLKGRIDVLGEELHNRQLILSMLQVILFLWMIVSSFRSRCKRAEDSITDHKFLLDTMPGQPQVVDTDVTDTSRNTVRRNSDVGISSAGLPVDAAPLKRQSSDTNIVLSSSPQASPTSHDGERFERGSSQASKKKKKKKLNKLLQQQKIEVMSTCGQSSSILSTSGHLSIQSSVSPTQTASFSSQAGVLFGTNVKVMSEENYQSTIGTNNPSLSSKQTFSYSSPQALKENLPVLSLGIISNQEMNSNSSEKRQNSFISSAESSFDFSTDKSFHWMSTSNASPIRDKSLTPPLGSVENVPRMEQRLSNRSHSISSPEKENGSKSGRISLSNSPEFKLPSYHRNKLRKLGRSIEFSSDTLSMVKKGKGIQKQRGTSHSTGIATKTKDFSASYNAMDCLFDEETLLSKNRFQLPFSPSKLDNVISDNSSWSDGRSSIGRNLFDQNYSAVPTVSQDQHLVNGASLSFGIPFHAQPGLSNLPSLSSSLSSSSKTTSLILSSPPPVLQFTSPSLYQPPKRSQSFQVQSPPSSASPPPPPPSPPLPPPSSMTFIHHPSLNCDSQALMSSPSFYPMNQNQSLVSYSLSPILNTQQSNSMGSPLSIHHNIAQNSFKFQTKSSSLPPTPLPTLPAPSPPSFTQVPTSFSSSLSHPSILAVVKKDKRNYNAPPSSSTAQQPTLVSPHAMKDKSDTKETSTLIVSNSKKNRNSQHRREGSYSSEDTTTPFGLNIKIRGSSEGKLVAGKSGSSSAANTDTKQMSSCLPKMKKSGSCSAMLWGRAKGGKQSQGDSTVSRSDSLSPSVVGKRHSTHC